MLRQAHPRIRPLACLEDAGCHLGMNTRCMELLVRRLGRIFDAHPALEAVVAHWQGKNGEHWGTHFDRALLAPRVTRLRTPALRYYLAAGARFPIPGELLG